MTKWVGRLLGLDESLALNGVFHSTASECCLVAAIAARERAIRIILKADPSAQRTREEIFSRLVLYGSTETHSLGAKAALVLGIPFKALKTFEKDGWALTGEIVRDAIEHDKAKGLIPFMISKRFL